MTTLASDVPEVALLLGLAALAGLTGSWLLARRIKNQTRGLEPGRDRHPHRSARGVAALHPEGVVGVDPAGRVTLANDGARDLLDLPEDCVGRAVDGLGLEPDVADVLSGGRPASTWSWSTGTGCWSPTGGPPAPAGGRVAGGRTSAR